jgi:hypothetical protein
MHTKKNYIALKGEELVGKHGMIEKARELAQENHVNGLNCGESTLRAILETLREAGMTDCPMEVLSLASTGNTCCAFIGAAMGISAIHGRKDPYELPTPEERRNQLGGDNGRYRLYNNFVFALKEKIGSTSCAELTCPYDYYSDERKLFCRNIIGEAAALGIEWIFTGIEKGYAHPFHYNIMGKK